MHAFDEQTDRRTDRIPIARPRLHSIQRGKNHTYLRRLFLEPTIGTQVKQHQTTDVAVFDRSGNGCVVRSVSRSTASRWPTATQSACGTTQLFRKWFHPMTALSSTECSRRRPSTASLVSVHDSTMWFIACGWLHEYLSDDALYIVYCEVYQHTDGLTLSSPQSVQHLPQHWWRMCKTSEPFLGCCTSVAVIFDLSKKSSNCFVICTVRWHWWMMIQVDKAIYLSTMSSLRMCSSFHAVSVLMPSELQMQVSSAAGCSSM